MKTNLVLTAALAGPLVVTAADNQIVGWNNLGMHCLDSDYSVFSILPPYNTIEAQLIVNGKLVTNAAGYTLTYQAVADPDGSINKSSAGKGNFSQFDQLLYGVDLAPEMGLAGWAMPGPNNTPQAMLFERTNMPAPGAATRVDWFRAEGIPITPYDDAGHKNPYPLMRLIARNASNQPVATNDIVLPVSDEMDCRACHGSGTQAAAQPFAGWVNDPNPERDYRLNILRLHDERQFAGHPALYLSALSARGFNAQGLYPGVVVNGQPVLCATCHASEALGTGSYSNIPPLTASMHSYHAQVTDPDLNLTLDNSAHRAACYRCHPGSATKCLRGAMGAAVASDGSMAMQCQSCHGRMSQVGSANRVGWFMEPNCQSCHTGTAASNNGQIRYTSVFEPNGAVRAAVNQTFATTPDTPVAGLSLYRFSRGHGGLQCSACHGSTHAEFPSSHRNDNLRNLQLEGHAGVMVECASCHTTMPSTATGGPHGLHPVGQGWVNRHAGLLEGGLGASQCQACHGLDYRGTVLSRAQTDRVLSVNIEGSGVTVQLFRGATVGCYNCHNGPDSDDVNSSKPPGVSNLFTNTATGQPVAMALPVTGPNATVRIIAQPAHGSVGLNNRLATYFPDPAFVGVDAFKFAAYDGLKNSTLATATVAVGTISDPIPPTVVILSPTPNATYTATGANLTLSGTASDNVGVASVAWSNDRGDSGLASGTTTWTAGGINLQGGVNVITVTARDVANNPGTDTLTVIYPLPGSLIVNLNGNGTVTPNLDGQNLQIGQSYKITAKPGAGSIFAGWSGSLSAATPTLTFVMQSNLVLQANFIPNPFESIRGNYTGLFCEGSGVAARSAGAFTLAAAGSGAFSGRLQLGNSRLSFRGMFGPAGAAQVTVNRRNLSPLSIALQLDLANGTDHITGTVSDGSWTAELAGDRAVFNGKTQIAPQTGSYTFIIPGSDDSASEPQGHSYGTMSVTATGRVRLRGMLADNTKFSQSSAVSKHGQCPLYSSLYGGPGLVLGWLTFSNAPAHDLTGELLWTKPAMANTRFYPAGFNLQKTISGSRYDRPAKGVRVLDFANAELLLRGGNLTESIASRFTLGADNRITDLGTNRLSLSFSLSSGLFKGSVLNPATAKTLKLNGVLVQKRNAGYGCFLGSDQSGSVALREE